MGARLFLTFVALVSATPAWAEGSTTVPEGSHITLFALGLLGVIVGRRAAITAQKRQREREGKQPPLA